MELWINELWLFGTASLFTIVGYVMGYNNGSKSCVEATIDALIDNGYLRWRKEKDGEIEIMKWNHIGDD